MRRTIANLAAAMLLALPITAPAFADEPIEDDLQQWTLATVTLPLSEDEKWLGYMEVQPRVGGNLTEMSALLVRPAIGYQINEHVSVWQGYAWTPTFQPDYNTESRIFQQLLTNHQWKKLGVVNRTRLEERWIDGAGETAVRARHMLRLAYPLDKDEKWFLVGYDELFINLNDTDTGPQAGFNQNRAFLGINRKLNSHVSVEAGYINNLINRHAPSDLMNHILFIGIYTAL